MKQLTIALVFLAAGIGLYFLGVKLSKEKHSPDSKKTFADYHGEFTIAGIVFFVLSFVNLVIWLWLNFFLAKR